MEINKISNRTLPERLQQLASPPKEIYVAGGDLGDLLQRPMVAIVGSRKVTPYGRQVTTKLARELAEQGVVVVSGLALGVDAIAHQAALDAGGLTIAVLPGPVDTIYPVSHWQLAQQIAIKGGILLSEYPTGVPPLKQNFVARNRLVAGLCDVLLITEAAEKSGSLHTARFALEQGKDVLAVPGNITSATSVGANNLIKSGAMPATSAADILNVLQAKYKIISPVKIPRGANAFEQAVIDLLKTGLSDGELLQRSSELSIAQFNQTLTMLELSGKIRPLGAGCWALA